MSDEFEYMSRACSVIQGINEIVKRNLKFADRHATNMEIERSLVYDVSKIIIILIFLGKH